MIGIIIYCIACYLFEIGFAIACVELGQKLAWGSLLLAPITAPIELGEAICVIVMKQ